MLAKPLFSRCQPLDESDAEAPNFVSTPGPDGGPNPAPEPPKAPESDSQAGPEAEPAAVRGQLCIVHSDNLRWLAAQPAKQYQLIYIDPPFNTGRRQKRTRIEVKRDPAGGDRIGFGGHRYKTISRPSPSYHDHFDDYWNFIRPRLEQAYRLLHPHGSLFVHLDPHEVHAVKIGLDQIFGRSCFMNEIIWAYDYGARSKKRWSAKHDTILWYAKDPRRYTYAYDRIDRIPYLAPKLVGPEKAKRGKTPTDVWWATIVSPTGREKTGYPTQKPLSILRRIVRVHSEPGDRLLDFFAGSGSFGEAAQLEGRSVTLVDHHPEAISVMCSRLKKYDPRLIRLPTGVAASNSAGLCCRGLESQLCVLHRGDCRAPPVATRYSPPPI